MKGKESALRNNKGISLLCRIAVIIKKVLLKPNPFYE